MLSVKYKLFVLSVIMLNVVMLNVIILSIVAPCGQYYKSVTIIIMMIVSDATIWSVTYGHN